MALSKVMSVTLRNTTLTFLSGTPVENVKIDGNAVANPNEIVTALKEVRPLPLHRSYETDLIQIELRKDSCSLLLIAGRDSQNPQEYWIFYPPGFSFTTKTHIGGIFTNIFAKN